MSPLRLTLREPPIQRVDLSPLWGDQAAGKSLADIGAIELVTGNRRVRTDQMFALEGNPGAEIEIIGATGRLDRIGARMTTGRIIVRGDVGAYLGQDMTGGSIEIAGNAGAFAAAGMRAGRIQISGNAGDFLGAALPGDHQGMRGGLVSVSGRAGDRAGDRMRRGVMLIAGDTGDYCASRMVAGTIAVWGRPGKAPGFAMRRGTLLLKQPPAELLPTFNPSGEFPLGVLTLLVRSWRGLPGVFGTLSESGLRARRFMGDRANGGVGEILVLA
jgi:formylmethanofuran dehydrogenase subunit C